jgi:hypothetical protein
VRSIDRETRRLDSIERGEPVPASTSPAATPEVVLPGQFPSEILGREPRRLPPKPKAAAPRPLAAVPAPNSPLTGAPSPPAGGEAVAGQQAPPLPPPIEVRPAPTVPPRPPKPKPPLVLTPPAQGSTSQQTY